MYIIIGIDPIGKKFPVVFDEDEDTTLLYGTLEVAVEASKFMMRRFPQNVYYAKNVLE